MKNDDPEIWNEQLVKLPRRVKKKRVLIAAEKHN
jgi:hypothetical protein